MGYCPQYNALLDYYTVKEALEFYSKLRGLSNEEAKVFSVEQSKKFRIHQYFYI